MVHDQITAEMIFETVSNNLTLAPGVIPVKGERCFLGGRLCLLYSDVYLNSQLLVLLQREKSMKNL